MEPYHTTSEQNQCGIIPSREMQMCQTMIFIPELAM